MLSDLSRHCEDKALTPRDFTWFLDIKLSKNDINTNKCIMEYLEGGTPTDLDGTYQHHGTRDYSVRNLVMPFKDFMGPILDETPGSLWFFTIPIGLVSYFYQKRTMERFKEENVEYFI